MFKISFFFFLANRNIPLQSILFESLFYSFILVHGQNNINADLRIDVPNEDAAIFPSGYQLAIIAAEIQCRNLHSFHSFKRRTPTSHFLLIYRCRMSDPVGEERERPKVPQLHQLVRPSSRKKSSRMRNLKRR